MQFHEKRRQQFLGERHFQFAQKDCDEGIKNIGVIIAEAVHEGDLSYAQTSASMRALLQFNRLLLHYTAGEPIEPLRAELEEVIAAYERYGEHLWNYTGDRNDVVFEFYNIDDYCPLMQLIGLCFLLHRRDLLPRLAALQDGVDAVGQKGQGTGGADWLFEEFMSFAVGPQNRYESETVHWAQPYEALADAMSSEDNATALKDLDRFLKHWYKDLAGTGWHDAHRTEGGKDPAGYYGYWSFEAGAAVLLLGIEDDSSLHKYLYYPKDLVAWARANAALSDTSGDAKTPRLRCPAGQPCPHEGYWHTPAKVDSRRFFKTGEIMPRFEGDYGETIWQRDERQ